MRDGLNAENRRRSLWVVYHIGGCQDLTVARGRGSTMICVLCPRGERVDGRGIRLPSRERSLRLARVERSPLFLRLGDAVRDGGHGCRDVSVILLGREPGEVRVGASSISRSAVAYLPPARSARAPRPAHPSWSTRRSRAPHQELSHAPSAPSCIRALQHARAEKQTLDLVAPIEVERERYHFFGVNLARGTSLEMRLTQY